MSSMSFGESSVAVGALDQQQQQFQQRNDTAENSTRLATNAFTYRTTGVGQIVVANPVMFDCVFTEEPAFTSGVSLAQAPDATLYMYPLVTAAVYRWVKEPQKPRTSSTEAMVNSAPAQPQLDEDTEPMFYKGAYVYFTVRVDPLQAVRTDGSNLLQLQDAYATLELGDPNRVAYQKLIVEAQTAQKLVANPPKTVLHHHLVFAGIAMKKLSDSITKLANDPQPQPRVPPVVQGT